MKKMKINLILFSNSILTSRREYISVFAVVAVCCNKRMDKNGGVFEDKSGGTFSN